MMDTELGSRKEEALATLRSYSKILTEPSDSPGEPPYHRYTLRGVCTEPHVTYVLRRRATGEPKESETDGEWQWWRISFSIEDAKARRAAMNPDNPASKDADVVGYTARKVREVEVLKAARDESKTVLLVYAHDNAMNMQDEPAPPQLQVSHVVLKSAFSNLTMCQEFVNMDNKAFDAEFEESGAAEIVQGDRDADAVHNPPDDSMQTDEHSQGPVNVFDYQVGGFDRETESGQEMQERGGRPLLSRSNTAGLAQPAQNPESGWDEISEAKVAP